MKLTKSKLKEIIKEELLNEAKLWQAFNKISNALADLKMKGLLNKAGKQKPQLKSELKDAETLSRKLISVLDKISDNLS